MNIVMAQLLNILDSWITFEDDVMIELDAAESASQFTMQGIVGEVHLVESASQFTMQGIVGEVGLVTDTSNLLMNSVLETVCLNKKPICTILQTELLGSTLFIKWTHRKSVLVAKPKSYIINNKHQTGHVGVAG
jgi:hypothetical protein